MRRFLLLTLFCLCLFYPLLIAPPAAGPLSALITFCLLGTYSSSVLIRLVRPAGNVEHSITGTGDSHTEKTWTVPESTTDQLCNIAIDVDKVTSFFIVSTADVALEANNATTPDFTLTLKANQPYYWHTNSLDTFKCTTDVTCFYATTGSGCNAVIDVDVIQDSTP
jgi:hypothetical protein